jgi:asparagine synthase (glutamine-hydrolysing)
MARLAKGFIASATMGADERYRSYLQVVSRESVAQLMLAAAPVGAEDRLHAAFASAGRDDELNRMFAVDVETQLPDDLLLLTDKMSMAVSLECRVPLLDHRLVEIAARIPGELKVKNGTLKHLMKQALSPRLPDDILHRAKRGFGTPMGAWLKKELLAVVRELLSPAVVKERGLFRPEAVSALLADHESNRSDGTDALLALLNLEVWSRVYLDRRSSADVADELKLLAAPRSAMPARVAVPA